MAQRKTPKAQIAAKFERKDGQEFIKFFKSKSSRQKALTGYRNSGGGAWKIELSKSRYAKKKKK